MSVTDDGASIVLVYTLYGSAIDAEAAARRMVADGLAACANVAAPATSFYAWDGAIQREAEHPVLFKTTAISADALVQAIGASHPYDLPAILRWAVETTPDYANWIADLQLLVS